MRWILCTRLFGPRIVGFSCLAVVTLLSLISLPRAYAAHRFHGNVHSGLDTSAASVGIVFGAGLMPDGTPSTVLADRMATAAALYEAGKIKKLLLSGDNRIAEYNEPQSMYEYGVRLGVPSSAMVRDYAGRRTYDTCRRARDVFGVEEALLITQRYHLDRALLTCSALGLKVEGVAADQSPYPQELFITWWMRELPATAWALWDLAVPPKNVVLGEPLPI